jgi:two-component system sensor histidine kinase QseC
VRLVERFAELMGARLERDGGEPPMTTRFTLRWPRPVSGSGPRTTST